MSGPRIGSTMIEGRVEYTTSHALRIIFRTGPGDPLAVAVRGAGNGPVARSAIALGVRNGGTGKHRIRYADGSIVWVESKTTAPTVVRRGDGAAIGTISRARTSTAVSATAGTLFHFVPDPDEPMSAALFRILVLDRMGAAVAHLDVVRTAAGWSLARVANDLYDTYLWWGEAGSALAVPVLGTRLSPHRALDRTERDVLLGVCVDITLGLRPYTAAMR
ncbi:hypothetical protein [Nocardia jejuensis]|uniref:hypothetical protein n=1 Tax=Nocardia jejuensis TaxID=328049 RepID=UPI000B241220|nr:hypothetical protein [Nocardia jejuensis]